jgi:hypothetical protein
VTLEIPIAGTAAAQIEHVEQPASPTLHGHVDSPSAGETLTGHWVPLSGWALDREGRPVEIEVSEGWIGVDRVACKLARPDIPNAYPSILGAECSGFSTCVPTARLPHEFELRLTGIVAGVQMQFARVCGRRRRFAPLEAAPLTPLAITTLGRTGSTLLMTLLSQHPAIAAYKPTAYDSRPFAYHLSAATRLSSPRSRMAQLDDWWLGGGAVTAADLRALEGPVSELVIGSQIDALLQSSAIQAATFARDLAAAEGKADVRYAAEKTGPTFVPRLMHELCPATREIFLVRDFRDVITSILAFNSMRGFDAFGREEVGSDEAFVERLAVDVRRLAAAWAERRDRGLVVRYEDLASRPEEVLASVFAYLQLDASGELIGAIIDRGQALLDRTGQRHRTSAGVSASTGRWRNDLSASMQEACTAAFADALLEFGYQ